MKSPELDDKTEGVVPVGFSDVLGHIYRLFFPIDQPKYLCYLIILRFVLSQYFYKRGIPLFLTFCYSIAKPKIYLVLYRIKHFFHFNWFVFRCLIHNFLMLYFDADIEPPEPPKIMWPNEKS